MAGLGQPPLSLSLFMTGVAANDEHHPAAADNLAVIANPFHAGTYFHDSSPSFTEMRSPTPLYTASSTPELSEHINIKGVTES
jgi:hypothetical protein